MIAGKRKLCYTEVPDFTNIQGVGNDPIYKRYSSVFAIIKQHIKEDYQSFLAEPEYSADEDRIYWYTDIWSNDTCPVKCADADSESVAEYEKQLDIIVHHYRNVIDSLSGEKKKILDDALKFIDKQFIYCIGEKLVLGVWGMQPDLNRHNASGVVVHDFDFTDYGTVTFDPGEHGVLSNKLDARMKRKSGAKLTSKDLPKIIASEGFEFLHWEPELVGSEVRGNMKFKAIYQKTAPDIKICNVEFTGDENCEIDGIDTIQVEHNTILTDDQIPSVKLKEGFSFAGWNNDINSPINDDIVFKAISSQIEPGICHVRFAGDDGCILSGDLEIDVPKGETIPENQIPEIKCNTGYKSASWSEKLYAPITGDTIIYATSEKDETRNVTVNFNSGENGILNGTSSISLPAGSILISSQIPSIKEKRGFKFVGWDMPLDVILNEDTTFNALYEENTPWWKRLWLWLLASRGCLLRFLVFLILLLAFLFLLSLLRQCDGSNDALSDDDFTNGPAIVTPGDSTWSHFKDIPGYADDGLIGDIPSTPVDNPDLGEDVDPGNGDNDYHAGVLPPDVRIPPIANPDNPQGPQIIPNVINVFFADDNANLNAFAKDFREIYPDTQKYLLDYDDLVKRISIMMPMEERESMKNKIERHLGRKYSFFIVDEFAIQQGAHETSSLMNRNSEDDYAGWHLIAVDAPEAWSITWGSPDITVAVVDDGFDITHDCLKDKIVSPYNVWTKSNELTYGSGHGTHTAGLAVGLVREDGKAGGIAPGCKLMPVQVFNGEQSTISAEISGIAYAIHNGADVVNISMGCSYAGFRGVPPAEQLEIAKNQGKQEELLWRRVFKMAKEKNAILVFSAGNDNVLSYLNPQNRPDSLISVTAVDRNLNQSIFSSDGAGSNYGLGSTIAAPGSDIYSCVPVNDYAMMQGTSMAAPIVTGVVALLKSIKKDITAGQTIDILTKSGKKLSDDALGPLVQADRALILLTTGSLPSESEEDDSTESGENVSRRDYSHIFQQIAEHQRAIVELIKQLPPEEQEKFRQ